MELSHRSFEIETRSAGNRTVELTFSSEQPVDRGDYLEILSHAPADMDLSRLNDSHPLLLNHDPAEQIGIVETATVSNGKGRAKVRFGNSQKAQEVFADVKDGIRKLVSVGYKLLRQISETRDKANNRVVRFAWQPYEVSIVAVPADTTVGVGRAVTQSKITIMNQNTDTQNEIRAIASNIKTRVQGCDIESLAERRILEGTTLEAFRREALSYMPQVRPIEAGRSDLSDVAQRDWKRYSLSRAVANGGRDGFEGEMSQELARRSGKAPSGFFVPDEAFSRSLIAGTSTLGGMLVATTPEGLIPYLRNKSQVLALGAQVMELSHPITMPRQSASGVVNFVGETVASTLTSVEFTNLTLTPYAVSANHQYSKQLLITGSESCDNIIRQDIIASISEAIDLACLSGSGSGQPTGIANTAGISNVTLATNGQSINNATLFPALVSLESALAASNADFGRMAYLMRGTHRASAKKQVEFASTASPVWTTERVNGVSQGIVNGYHAAVSNQIFTNGTVGTATTICSAIFLSDWSDVIVASFGPLDLVADNLTKADQGIVRLLARKWFDVGVKTPAKHAILRGILAT